MTLVMPKPPRGQSGLLTAEEFAALPDTKGLELEDGCIVEKHLGTKSGWIGGHLFFLIGLFLREHRLGWIFPSEAIYRCFPDDPNRLRKPDVSFIRYGRLPGEQVPDPYIAIAPDLAVEVISPNDTATEVERKMHEYLSVGVRLIWLVYPETRTVHILRANGSTDRVNEGGQVSGEEVLPGFQFAVADLFPVAVP
jgi:Uma2 family endonuclease